MIIYIAVGMVALNTSFFSNNCQVNLLPPVAFKTLSKCQTTVVKTKQNLEKQNYKVMLLCKPVEVTK